MAVTLGLGPDHALVVRRVIDPQTGRVFADTAALDTSLLVKGEPLTLTEARTGLRFDGARAERSDHGVHLVFTYSQREWRATIARHYASYPDSPVIEAWTTVEVAGDGEPLAVADLTCWRVSIPAGTLRWVNGLRGDAPDTPVDDAFSIGARDLASGESFDLGAQRRSSERFIPLVTVDIGSGRWFAGVQWSGRWHIGATRNGQRIELTVDIPDTATRVTPDQPLEVPHSFIGFASGSAATLAEALRGFIAGLRAGRPIRPLVTYNTWYPYGARVEEASVNDEIDRTAALGVELFVLDAGWYAGAGALAFSDFESGLGTWTADPARFPSGLRALSDRAHARGMKFGLWVEPGRVSLDTVGQPGLARDEWLARSAGANVTPTSGQICYGARAAREWVRAKLFALIDDVQPDYLKWDNNAWVNCDRAGHDHGPDDGNLRQVEGLYALLQELRDRYPALLIENVADGGSRIDFGMLRYSDAAWLDDRTSPGIRVRHNLQGAFELFPPGYLLSFVLDSPVQPLANSDDPLTELRSSMMGALGFGYRSPTLRPWLSDAIRDLIAWYGQLRDILQDAHAFLLTAQAPAAGGDGWDAVEALNASTGEATLFVFHLLDATDRVVVHPRGLESDATYSVRSLDAGDLGTARGASIMEDGVEIVQGSGTHSHVLALRKAY